MTSVTSEVRTLNGTQKSVVGILQVWILVLCSFIPFVIIVGNIAPKIGSFKLHWFFNGGIALLVLISLGLLIKKWKIHAFVIGCFLFLNAACSVKYDVGEAINTLVGPFLFYYFLILVEHKLIIRKGLWKLLYIYLAMSFVPLSIAVLQFIGLAPLTIWAFDYVNVTRIDGQAVARVNGFLYHPSELANINYLLFSMLTVWTNAKFLILPLFVLFFLLQMLILIKSTIAGTFLLLTYFVYCHVKLQMSAQRMIFFMCCFGGLMIFALYYQEIAALLSDKILSHRKNIIFEPSFLTNRGRMWSIYAYSISEMFGLENYLFGSGFGSNKELFIHGMQKVKIWPNPDYIPHPHNQFLSIFINGGLALMLIYSYLFIKLYAILKKLMDIRYSMFPIVMIFLFTSGLTVLVLDRFSSWVSMVFMLVIFYLRQYKE